MVLHNVEPSINHVKLHDGIFKKSAEPVEQIAWRAGRILPQGWEQVLTCGLYNIMRQR